MDKSAALQDKLTRVRQETLALAHSLTDDDWRRPVFSEETQWRVVDLFSHLVDAERSMTSLMKIIRDGGEGVPADFDLQRWNDRITKKAQQNVPADLIAALEPNRQTLLALIDTLSDEDWQKKGRHGSLRIMSIEEIAHLIADHEQSHCADIRRVVG